MYLDNHQLSNQSSLLYICHISFQLRPLDTHTDLFLHHMTRTVMQEHMHNLHIQDNCQSSKYFAAKTAINLVVKYHECVVVIYTHI